MLGGKVIVLEGLIGVGKSTLGRSFEKHLQDNNIEVVWMSEPINQVLLELYISDMTKYAFPFQVIIARERIQIYKEARRLAAEGKVVFIDRGLPGDLAFAYMQKNKGFFTEREFNVYLNLISAGLPDSNIQPILTPDAIIHLDCTAETAWKRILARGNSSEKNGYSLKYLRDLHKSYERALANYNAFRIDWNIDQPVQNDILSLDVCREVLRMCQLDYLFMSFNTFDTLPSTH